MLPEKVLPLPFTSEFRLRLQASSVTAGLRVTSRTLQGEDGKTGMPEDTAALGFGGRLEFLLWAGLSPNLFPLEFLFCLDVVSYNDKARSCPLGPLSPAKASGHFTWFLSEN